MKIYFAVTGQNEPIYLPKNNMNDMLMSFHYYKKKPELIKDLISQGNDIFIDSGAFSAESSGKPINIDDYCNFLKAAEANNYVCLDVIRNAEATEINLKYMESQGLKPFPVFHKTSHEKWLYKYLEEYDKIALGGAVKAGELEYWLDATWQIILKEKPTMNVHGFGITSPEIMMRYPWTSCDSSSFKAGRRFGRLIHYLPHKKKFFTSNFNKWVQDYAEEQNCPEIITNSKLRYEITDVFSAKSFMDFANDKKSLDINSYPHLTDQYKLF